ncbi:hypothetical protein BB558_004120, partial [Smittium angustum]
MMIEQTSANVNQKIRVTGFLNKLYSLVDEPSTDEYIRWTEGGDSFIVNKHEDFAREILPKYFKHNNFSSFVRQLNMYKFHKVPHPQHGVLLAEESADESWEFSNTYFQRNQPDLLHFVVRNTRSRASKGDSSDTSIVNSRKQGERKQSIKQYKEEIVTRDLENIIKELDIVKGHQLTLSSEIKRVKQENKMLWAEVAATSKRFVKQQERIEGIIKFLASMF